MTYGSGHGLQLGRQSRSFIPVIPARSTVLKIITSIAFGSTDAYPMGWRPWYLLRAVLGEINLSGSSSMLGGRTYQVGSDNRSI